MLCDHVQTIFVDFVLVVIDLGFGDGQQHVGIFIFTFQVSSSLAARGQLHGFFFSQNRLSLTGGRFNAIASENDCR